MALIWFSCFCCASENLSVMPASLAALLIDSVLAVRHSLSAPTWLKPSTSGLSALNALPGSKAASEAAAARVLKDRRLNDMNVSSLCRECQT